ncbi:MAG: HDOD domain-containing protein [Ignavibacteriales bacterium]|nr:HDOD domain-containing protein [Ignavibacteriales bacterium]
MANSPHDLLKGYVEISSLPMIYTQINEAINNPRKSLADIARIVSEDSGLSARLLRIVNSAFYNFPTHIETVSRAVAIVGIQELRALAILTSVMQLFKGIPSNLVSMESFWRHSIACGLTAKMLATHRRETNVELFFTAGILHDLGRLIMFQKEPERSLEAMMRAKDENKLLYVAEREVFGYDHAAVGRILVQSWKLPPRVEEVVAFHHSPAAASRFPVETAIVHVADVLAHVMRLGNSGEHCVPPLDRSGWDSLGLSLNVLTPIVEQVERQYNDSINSMIAGDNT